jgi:hypothetical protein
MKHKGNSDYELLAKASGYAIYKQNDRLYFTNLGTAWIYTTRFVLGLLTFILGVNGIIQLVLSLTGSSGILLLGIILTGIALLLFFLFRYINGLLKQKNDRSLTDQDILCMIDLKDSTLLDASGNVLAELDQVTMCKKMQITSSSPALELNCAGNAITIINGNPVAGGIAPYLTILKQYGL